MIFKRLFCGVFLGVVISGGGCASVPPEGGEGMGSERVGEWLRDEAGLAVAEDDAEGVGRDAGAPAVYHSVVGRHPDGGRPVRMDFVVFDSRRVAMKVVDQGMSRGVMRADLGEAMESVGALAGANGGFFHPDGRPLGLMIAGGEEVNRIESGSSLVGGVLWDDGRVLRLQRVAGYLAGRTSGVVPENLLQAGPFLVDGGRVTVGLDDQRSALRTVMLADGTGRFALGRVDAVTLDALGRMLGQEGLLPGFRVRSALNLDGGRSTAFWVGPEVEGGGGEVRSWPGRRGVRNLIALTLRDQGM